MLGASASVEKGNIQENIPKPQVPMPVKKKEDPCIIKREEFDVCMKIRSIDDSCFHVLDDYLKCAANDSKQRVRGVPGVY
jgi:hypothetical protein